jgi:hypothetical protein
MSGTAAVTTPLPLGTMSNMANDLTPAQKKLFDQLDVSQMAQDNLLKAQVQGQDNLLKAQEKITANWIDLINTIAATTLAVEGPTMFTPTATTTTTAPTMFTPTATTAPATPGVVANTFCFQSTPIPIGGFHFPSPPSGGSESSMSL